MAMPLLPATAEDILHAASPRIGRIDAEVLLLHVLGHPRSWLFAHPEAALSPQQMTAFEALPLCRRL